jgi:hypothetical protein
LDLPERTKRRKRNSEMVIGAGNVGSLRNLKGELNKYKIGSSALQEIIWKGVRIMDTGNFTFLSGCNRNNTLGTGFLVDRNYSHSVRGPEPVKDRICVLMVRARFFNIRFICVYAAIGDA